MAVQCMMRAMRLGRAVLAVLIGAVAFTRGADAQALLDFVTFDGIDYIRWAEEPGRALVGSDLGQEFATVGCSVGEDRRACADQNARPER